MYYKYKFLSMNNNPKNTWKIINSVCNPIKSKKSIILKENNTTIDNGCTIANKLNKSFDAPTTNSSLTDDATQYISMHNHSFACFPITPQEVFNVLMNMKNNSILSEFPIKLLKFLKEPLCILLSNIFNYALTQMKFPDILKTGIITPILKKGSPYNIDNYRGITVLNPFSKIFDNLLYNRLYSFFDKFNLFSQYQYGFRKGRGTEQASLNLLYIINQAIQNNESCIAVFIDLSKAFDRVNTFTLLRQLHKYGLRGD